MEVYFSLAPKQDAVKMEIIPEICTSQQPGIKAMPMFKSTIQTAPIEISSGTASEFKSDR